MSRNSIAKRLAVSLDIGYVHAFRLFREVLDEARRKGDVLPLPAAELELRVGARLKEEGLRRRVVVGGSDTRGAPVSGVRIDRSP